MHTGRFLAIVIYWPHINQSPDSLVTADCVLHLIPFSTGTLLSSSLCDTYCYLAEGLTEQWCYVQVAALPIYNNTNKYY